MWAACALLFWWMTVAFSSTCNDLFCLSGCTGQGFLPVLLRGLTAVTTVLLVDGASTQHSCLQFAFNTVGSIQEHWACLPVQSAKKPSCRTCKCVGVWRSPPPPQPPFTQGRNLFVMVQVLTEAAYWVGVPWRDACWGGQIEWGRSAGECLSGAHSNAKC